MAYKPGNPGDPGKETTSQKTFLTEGTMTALTPTPGVGPKLGYPVLPGYQEREEEQVTLAQHAIAAFMRISMVPTIGKQSSVGDPINLAAERLYKQIQTSMRNRNLPYDRTDVMVALLALDSVHMGYTLIARAYRALFNYNELSRYEPSGLLQAMGFDYEDWADNVADIAATLELWEKTLMSIPVPRVLPLIDMHHDMCTNLYSEDDSLKSQVYIFTFPFLYSYGAVDTGGGLTYTPWTTPSDDEVGTRFTKARQGTYYAKWSVVKENFLTMLNAILNSTDFSVINAAFQSTWEGKSWYTMEAPKVGEGLKIIDGDADVLNAIENMTLCDISTEDELNSLRPIDDGTGKLTTNPRIKYSNGSDIRLVTGILNMREKMPTAKSMYNALRWHIGASRRASADRYLAEITFTTEFPMSAYVYKMVGSRLVTYGPVHAGNISDADTYEYADYEKFFEVIPFRRHPQVAVVMYNRESGESSSIISYFTQWYNAISSSLADTTVTHEFIIYDAFMGVDKALTGQEQTTEK